MEGNNHKKELSVGLLFSDLVVAKNISRIFRKLGIVPYVYETLEDFWEEKVIPSLLIADVTLMSSGELALADFDAVKKEQLPLAFYYEQRTKPLLVSTYNLFHLGLISGEDSLEGQLKGVLKRLNHFFRLQRDSQLLTVLDQKHRQEVRSLYTRAEQLSQFHHYNEELGRLIRLIEAKKNIGDFYFALESVLANESMFEAFSYFELSPSGQKLITPTSSCKKFQKIPSLWLKDCCNQGIEPYAQNLAAQVALELMGERVISLYLRAEYSQPSALLFVKVKDDDYLNLFDWDLFETYLSGVFANFDLRRQKGNFGHSYLTPLWDIFSLLDNQIFAAKSGKPLVDDEEVKLIQVSFKQIREFVIGDTSIRFFWNIFYQDFLKLLFDKVKIDFSVAISGSGDLTFAVAEMDKDSLYHSLLEHGQTFSFWRYFDDADRVLNKSFTPIVVMIPNSTKALTDYLQKNSELFYDKAVAQIAEEVRPALERPQSFTIEQ